MPSGINCNLIKRAAWHGLALPKHMELGGALSDVSPLKSNCPRFLLSDIPPGSKGPNYFLIYNYIMEISENEMKITKIAYDEFLKQKIKTNLNIQYELDLISPYCTFLREQREELRQRQASKMGTLWLWLTISPKNDIDFETFRDKISTFAQRKMFDDHIYVFEQRGKTVETAGEGFHAHLLLKRNMKYKQNKIISNSKNTFKKITNVENHDIFNFHWCPEEYLNDKMEYILGTKTGKEKDIKQEIDIVFRQKKNLKEYYKRCLQSSEPPPSAKEPPEPLCPAQDEELKNQ